MVLLVRENNRELIYRTNNKVSGRSLVAVLRGPSVGEIERMHILSQTFSAQAQGELSPKERVFL